MLKNFIYQHYCYQLYYSYLFCRNKKIHLWSLFLIVYLHLQWKAVLTQIMLCLAEAVLRNSRFFAWTLLNHKHLFLVKKIYLDTFFYQKQVPVYWTSTRKLKQLVKPSFKLSWESLIFQQNIYRRKIPPQCHRNWPNLSRQLEWGL
jgi:hypothetical protein